MNVLFIGTTDIIGGAAKVSWTLKNALEKDGHQVSMFVADKKSNDPAVQTIPRSQWRKYLGFLLGSENLIATDWILNTKEYKEADIVHCHNLHGRYFNLHTLERMSKEKPVIWTMHDEWAITPHCANTMQGAVMKNGLYVCPSIDTPPRLLWNNSKNLANYKNKIYKNLTVHLVVPSLWLKSRVQQTLLRKQVIHHIPNGIDTSIFKQSDKEVARKKLGLPTDKRIVLILADDVVRNPWKGWQYAETLIDKYQDRKDILFLSVGSHNPVKSTVNNLEFREYANTPLEVADYYSAADVLIFTSLAENFPLVILEAMASGLPVVSFDVGGVKEALTHKQNGYIATYKDDSALEKGLNWSLALTPEEKNTLANNSIEKVTKYYRIESMINAYHSLYRKIIEDL